VLKWVLARVAGDSVAVDTPIGRVPTVEALDTDGLTIDAATVDKLLTVDRDAWRMEVRLIEGHYDSVGERLPVELRDELAELEKRLSG
jgi:phosphoenolpyruvate carboxykinase (GTP)